MELHNITHILLGIAVVGLAILIYAEAKNTTKTFRAEEQALLGIMTALKSQALLLAEIVKHIENDTLTSLLEQHKAEGKLKH